MNHTLASCGHPVPAIGAPGSQARAEVERGLCHKCLLKRRKKVCLQIAEHLENEFNLQRTEYDVDEAWKHIEAMMPWTIDECLAEDAQIEQEEKHHPRDDKPSVLVRLRKALGLEDKRIDIIQIITAACERLERANALVNVDSNPHAD